MTDLQAVRCLSDFMPFLVCTFRSLPHSNLVTAAGLGVMDLCVTIKGVSSLLPTGMGILGNSLVVLLAYVHIIYTEPRLLPVDMILCHPAFAT